MKCPYCFENVRLGKEWNDHSGACIVKSTRQLSVDIKEAFPIEEDPAEEKNLDAMTVDELKDFAKEIDIDLGKAKKKEAIIQTIVDFLDAQ